jgi:hypothetical protein
MGCVNEYFGTRAMGRCGQQAVKEWSNEHVADGTDTVAAQRDKSRGSTHFLLARTRHIAGAHGPDLPTLVATD